VGLWVRIPPGHGCLSVVNVCCQKFLRQATHSYRGDLSSAVCLTVISKPQPREGLDLHGLSSCEKKGR
jgi:hypothetical protein